MDVIGTGLGYNETGGLVSGPGRPTDAESSSEVSNPEIVFIRLWEGAG